MKRRHFETLRPICPSCRAQELGDYPLALAWVAREEGDIVLEGALECSNASCRLEYPILDGLPVLVPDAREYLADHLFHLVLREDLDPRIESLLGECAGPGSAFDTTRLHLSSYAWDHYGEFETRNAAPPRPSSIASVWQAVRQLVPTLAIGPAVEVGCSVGRVTFEMAEASQDLVLGVDLNASMLRLAQRVLRTGTVSFPMRTSGLLYERHECYLPFRSMDRVDFWIADGTALPFSSGTFARAVALNVIDAVASPLDLIRSVIDRVRPGGEILLATPYDWSSAVTHPAAWIGGHSPRAPGSGSGAEVLRALLTPGAHPASLNGVRIIGELEEVPWTVRMHDRAHCAYRLHAMAAIREDRSV